MKCPRFTPIAALLLSSSPEAVQSLLSSSSSSSLRGGSSSGGDGTTSEIESHHHRNLFEFDNPACGDAEYATQPYYVSPTGNNWSMENGWGLSVDKPFKTIQHAVDNRQPCQTIYIMEGTYQNNYYGQSLNHNNNNLIIAAFFLLFNSSLLFYCADITAAMVAASGIFDARGMMAMACG